MLSPFRCGGSFDSLQPFTLLWGFAAEHSVPVCFVLFQFEGVVETVGSDGAVCTVGAGCCVVDVVFIGEEDVWGRVKAVGVFLPCLICEHR